jgi:hypothetical protein
MAQVVNLRPLILDLIRQVRYPEHSGGILTVSTDLYGDVEVLNQDGEIHFTFPSYSRLFVLGAGGVLVERVKITPKVAEDKLAPLERVLAELIAEDNYPDKQGETIPIPYGEDDEICMLTRTPTGVLGEFLSANVKLVYDFRNRAIRPYLEDHTPRPRREAALKREKERARVVEAIPIVQKGYKGEDETVDTSVYSVRVECECGNVRYIKPQDVFQVKTCKVCVKKNRKKTPK